MVDKKEIHRYIVRAENKAAEASLAKVETAGLILEDSFVLHDKTDKMLLVSSTLESRKILEETFKDLSFHEFKLVKKPGNRHKPNRPGF